MTWAHYLLQVNLYLVIFYAFYKLLLAKETWFMLNRTYLLVSGALSLAIPFLRPEWFVKQSANYPIQITLDQLNIIAGQISDPKVQAGQFAYGKLLIGSYIVIVIVLIIRFILQLFAVQRLIKAEPTGTAFSFFRQKVIDKALPQLEIINKHEEIHIRQFHTLDVLFFELLSIVVWFNPVIYLYKSSIKNIHEYLADEEAANFQGDKETYAMLLLSKAFGVDQPVLTNNFHQKSLIKKRIFMLHKQRSKKTAILKYGLFLPLFGITLLFSSASIRKNEEIIDLAEKISPNINNRDTAVIHESISEKPAEQTAETPVITLVQANKVKHAEPAVVAQTPADNVPEQGTTSSVTNSNDPASSDQRVYDFVSISTQPLFPGGIEKFYSYLGKAIHYPVRAVENNVQGKVYMSFIVEKNGDLTDIKVTRRLDNDLDEEAVRVLKNSPKWAPGLQNGKAVRVKYNIPINFTINTEQQTGPKLPPPVVTPV